MSKKTSGAVKLLWVLFLFNQRCATDNTLEWHEADGYKWAKLAVPHSGKTGFKQLPESETGITFTNHLTKSQIDSNRIYLNGSGAAVGDVDGDGLADIYLGRLDGPNVLYKNLGNWQFENITDSAGVACAGQFSSGVALADLDSDADLDLLVTSVGGPNACFLNDGTGTFTEVTNTAGISSQTGASTMALADIDGDGDLDLYIANYKKKSAKDIWDQGELLFDFVVEKVGDSHRIAPKFQDHFVLDIRGQWALFFETGEPDMLFLNDGTGRFEKVALTDGRFLDENGDPASELKDWGLMVRFQDMDDDGDPDIYVCNDFESPDRIWINDGTGRFQALPKLAVRNTSNSSMAIDFSDVDRDGDQDFLVVDMLSLYHRRRMSQKKTEVPLPHPIGEIDNRPQYMKNTLFLNRGDNTYAEIAHFSGLQASEWSWSDLFLDVDLDGYEDVLVATGHYYDAQDYDAMMKADSRIRLSAMSVTFYSKTGVKPIKNDKLNTIFMYPRLELRNVAFHNRGDLTFEEVGKEWGFDAVDISHGMAFGDLDNDGDLDVVMNRLDAPAAIYRNETAAPRIAVRLNGLPPNTQGIGAKIRVLGGPAPQSKEVISAGTYLSSSDPLSVFAAHNAKNLTIEVKWRNGKVSTVTDARPNRIYEIYESAAQTDAIPPKDSIVTKPYFEDVSHLIKHEHHEDPFDDFRRQPLLPYRLSGLGPGVAWHDLDADGDDDLVITSGKGGQLASFRNDGQAGFHLLKDSQSGETTHHEQTAVLGWTKDGAPSLLIGSSNFESDKPGDSSVLRYDLKNGKIKTGTTISGGTSSIGPMAMADYDNDGDLDLFVGGRSQPARYPEPASSRLYRNEDGSFELDSLNSGRFKQLGLVSGAVFSDLDADGDADLILTVEWGPVMVFRNEDGVFSNVTEELGLAAYHGWWHGVTTGDLNEDGKLDIIAANWGLNSKYQGRFSAERPLQMLYGDFDNNGTLDIIQGYFDNATQRLLPEQNFMSMLQAMPYIRMRIPDNRKYSYSSLQEIIGPKLSQARKLHANTLAHMVFLNHGDRFEAVAMPMEAQFSPGFHVGVADFDGDGHEDVFMSQNFFSQRVETPRADAGRGLWLKGDGSGSLTSVPGQESGVEVYGEQRGAAFSDYDRDGRVDLVVSQNAAATKLYHNVGAKPGLRIRLTGPKGNPFAVGATIRLVYEDGFGPAREVHSGSGYWSQDSMIQVMGIRENATEIWVRWPGGHVTESTLPLNVRGINVKYDGQVEEHSVHD
ncbi:MAG: FG-GAP-like repeat-containing protein [bacterium]